MGLVNFVSDRQTARNLIVTGTNINVFMALYINKMELVVKWYYRYILYSPSEV
jgi:hypothetical protein